MEKVGILGHAREHTPGQADFLSPHGAPASQRVGPWPCVGRVQGSCQVWAMQGPCQDVPLHGCCPEPYRGKACPCLRMGQVQLEPAPLVELEANFGQVSPG